MNETQKGNLITRWATHNFIDMKSGGVRSLKVAMPFEVVSYSCFYGNEPGQVTVPVQVAVLWLHRN